MVPKQVYKITYPNGKIYVGMDLTGSLLYFGSPSASQQIAEDLDLDNHRFDLTLRKEILWDWAPLRAANSISAGVNISVAVTSASTLTKEAAGPRYRVQIAARAVASGGPIGMM